APARPDRGAAGPRCGGTTVRPDHGAAGPRAPPVACALMHVEAVLLDAGGVLTLPDPDLVRSVLAPLGLQPHDETLDHVHDVAIRAYDEWVAAGHGADVPRREIFLDAYVRAAGVPPERVNAAVDALRTAFQPANNPWARVRPGSVAGLGEICATGARVAVVSNAYGSVERELLELGVCQVGPGDAAQVAAVIDSHAVGIAKPDPGIFALALDAVGAQPQHAVHVGDSVWADVDGARAAGVRPIHFDPHGLCGLADHAHVGSLSAVPDLV
ncbi:MAG: HAD family hydrolase, partial [Actinomycetota bacterium]|nr:HAD family hydrolase [Actinomycetota bacterium]